MGDYLFTDADFINDLSTNHRNVFQRIYDEVKYLCKVAAAGSKEARQLEKTKKAFAEAYRAATKNPTSEGGVRYSIRNDIVDANGKEYDTVVELDKTVSKSTLSNPKRFMTYIENNLVGLKIPVADSSGNIEVIEFAGAKETVYKNQKKHPVLGELGYTKGDTRKQVIVNAKEVIEESAYDPVYSSTDNDHGWLDRNGWESRKTYVLTQDGMIYEAYLKIAKVQDGRNILYAVNLDINKGIAVDQGATQKRAAVLAAMPSDGKITQPKPEVNTNFSLTADERKEQQLAIILENNPMWDDYHTGIRSVEDIRTWEKVLELDDEREGQFVWGDFSREDAENALKNKSVTVYSSHPINNGTFVSTSYIQAWEYAGGNKDSKVYSKEVPLDEVAWINGDEGQYAKVEGGQGVVYSISGNEQAVAPIRSDIYGKDIELIDKIGAPIRNDLPKKGAAPSIETVGAPIREDIAQSNADAESTNKSHISLEDYANQKSPVWRNVEYSDDTTKTRIMQQMHDDMIAEGAVVTVADTVINNVEQAFPDLRSMKKKERNPILKSAMTKLKNDLRRFLNEFKNQSFEFEVNGKVLDATLYNTGINEVLEKVTKDKASMLYSTEEIFRNARYLYSTPDYDGDPNVYRWNYFYTPVQIGEETVGVRIAVRDMVKGTDGATSESQIYSWGIKKDASLGGGSHDPKAASSDASSDASNNSIPESGGNVNENAAGEPTKTGEANGRQRKWVKTSTESEAVDRKVLPEDLNQDLIRYQPISNKMTLGNANANLDTMYR